MSRYRFFTTRNKVICVSSYAGKTVKGYAICSENDEFDFEKGKALAKARCDQKVAAKRVKRAREKAAEAYLELRFATEKFEKMDSYLEDSIKGLNAANVALYETLDEM